MTLRLKITILSVLVSGGILLAFGVASWFLIYRERLAAVDREIRTLVSRHPGLFANRDNYDRLTAMLEFTFGEERKRYVVLMIRDRTGTVLYRSPFWPGSLDIEKLDLSFGIDPTSTTAQEPAASFRGDTSTDSPADFPAAHGLQGFGRGSGWGRNGGVAFTEPPRFMTIPAGETFWRLGVFSTPRTTVMLGMDYEAMRGELNRLRNTFLLLLPLALVPVAVSGWIIATRALRPLRSIADTAEHVTARGLDQRLPLSSKDVEMARLVRVLNGMMERLEKSFHQATRFTSDASHELKTPLTIMQGELEQALQHAAPGSNEQQLFSNLLEETQRLKNITRNLLLLAQADSGQLKLSWEVIHLADVLESALEDARILASDQELTFEVMIGPGLHVHGDRILLTTAIYNLLSNAVKFNEPHGRILLQAQLTDRQIGIAVGNTGPGIPEADRSRIFERFFRARQMSSRSVPGFGLGLSLAREIIRAHGGELSLQESRSGWTCFAIQLVATT